jgi:flagellar basal body-associated protein FliL
MAVGLLLVIVAVLGLLSVAALVALIVWLVRRTEASPANADEHAAHGDTKPSADL